MYEDVFDSYKMDLNTFKAQLNARLSEFNDNEEGHVYVIGYDAKHYYQATDEARLQGCESVIVSVTCHDGVTLGSGSTQYKCRTCGGSLNSHSKDCAMQTTVSGDDELDLSGLDELETNTMRKRRLAVADRCLGSRERRVGETNRIGHGGRSSFLAATVQPQQR